MTSFIDAAASVVTQSTRRVEIAAQNLTNVSTPGYRRLVGFSTLIGPSGAEAALQVGADLTAGQVRDTGQPYDLALLGRGCFVVRAGEGLYYTRQGQFHRDAEGRLLTPQGYVLQAHGGGDLTLKAQEVKIASDGMVSEDGQPTERLAIVTLQDPRAVRVADNGLLTASEDAVAPDDAPGVRQGALEMSNVSNGTEMVEIMAALRQAEAGQRLVNVYDDLMGRAITAFGQGSGS